MMNSITELWQRIERWLATYGPEILDTLQPGTTVEDLVRAETALDITLPENCKALYRLHNGGYFLLPWKERILPLGNVVQVWEMVGEWNQSDENFFPDEPPGPVQPLRGHRGWIPLLWSGYGGEYICLDLAPAQGGQIGQVILRPHEYEPARFVAWSLEALLSQIADDLEANKYSSSGPHFGERLAEENRQI